MIVRADCSHARHDGVHLRAVQSSAYPFCIHTQQNVVYSRAY